MPAWEFSLVIRREISKCFGRFYLTSQMKLSLCWCNYTYTGQCTVWDKSLHSDKP